MTVFQQCKASSRKTLTRKILVASLLIAVVTWYGLFVVELGPSDRSVFASFGGGRLDNQMSRFAVLYALAADHGVAPHLLEGQAEYMEYYFNLDPESVGFSVFGRGQTPYRFRYRWEKPYARSREMTHMDMDPALARGRAVALPAYVFEICIYFHHLPALRTLFRPRPDDLESALVRVNLTKGEYLASNSLPPDAGKEVALVAVHVRMTDYPEEIIKWKHGSNDTLSADYIARAVNYFDEKLAHPVFVFISDDVAATRQLVSDATSVATSCEKRANCHFFGPPASTPPTRQTFDSSTGVDLATMRMCQHFILSYGTFGTWGALLAEEGEGNEEKVVVMPKEFSFLNGPIHRSKLPGWIEL